MIRMDRTTVLAYGLSLVAHAVLLGVLIGLAVPGMWVPRFDAPPVTTTMQEDGDRDDQTAEPPIDAQVASADTLATAVPVESAGEGHVSPESPGLAVFVRQRLDEKSSASAQMSPEQRMRELETLGAELTRVANTESVTALSATLAGWLGSSDRQTAPSEEADDDVPPFDPATAQFSDVRLETADGQERYVALLVDAAGRSREVDLDAADGATLHRLFDLMKRFPLLETIYRQTVMGLLDRMMAAEPEVPAPVESEPASRDAQPAEAGQDEHQQDG